MFASSEGPGLGCEATLAPELLDHLRFSPVHMFVDRDEFRPEIQSVVAAVRFAVGAGGEVVDHRNKIEHW